MKSLLLLTTVFLFTVSFAQKREEGFDIDFAPVKDGAFYRATTEKKDSLWYRQAFYVSQKTKAMEGSYKDEEAKVPHGAFTWYHSNRQLKSQGRYVNGKKEDVWLSWNQEGSKLTDSSNYKAGRRIGISKAWHNNGAIRDSLFFDANGNGTQTAWFEDGSLATTANWIQDTMKTGTWKYYQAGKLLATEEYLNGKLVICNCYNETGVQLDSATCKETEAAPNGGPIGWRRFLERNLQSFLEARAKKIKAGAYSVPIRFMVEKDGSLSNFSALSAYGNGLEDDLLQLMKRAPRWTPGRLHGRIVRSYHTQPITFVIQ